MPGPRARCAEGGETLLELLVAVAIMGISAVAVLGGVANSIMVADIHRKQTTAGAAVHDYAEAVEYCVASAGYRSGPCAPSSSTYGYTVCAPAAAYAPGAVGFAVPTGYTSSVTAVQYWNGTQWTSSCTSDSGLQQVTLMVASGDGRAAETLTVVLREPCPAGC